MELDDSEMSRWCLETARNGDVNDVMKTLEALLLDMWTGQVDVVKLNTPVCEVERQKSVLVKRLLDLLCKQMLQFQSSYISYKQYVDTHIS